MRVLAINAGSSSLKAGLFDVQGSAATELLSAEAAGLNSPSPRFLIRQGDARDESREGGPRTHAEATRAIEQVIRQRALEPPDAVGHRIVHGGPNLIRHAPIDQEIEAKLREATEYAPLHVPPALEAYDRARTAWPHAIQVACLDTAFHADLPPVARTFPIDPTALDPGVRRYGFHGLSCESIVRQLGRNVPRRLIVAHLGGGASVTAIENGRSVDTTMGLTPSGGIVMGSRSGDLDPGLIVWLLRHRKLDAAALERLIDRECGLAGLSGQGSDMRRLRAAAASDPAAALAIDIFCYSAAKAIAGMGAALGGVDGLVFTGGIGEHDAATRAAISARLGWMGLGGSTMNVLPAEEDTQIALISAHLAGGR